MFVEVMRSGSTLFNYTEYTVETDDDIQSLPASEKKIAIGSKAYVANGNMYTFFGNTKKWVRTYDSKGGGGGTVPDEDIATDEDIDEMIDDVFGDDSQQPQDDTPGGSSSPVIDDGTVTSDEEFDEMVDEIFG